MNFSINIVDNISSNSGGVTFTPQATYRLETLTKNGGFRNEQKIYNIKGSTRSKNRITIATVEITFNSTKAQYSKRFFAKTPFLKTDSNIKLVLKDVETYSIANSDTSYRPGKYNHTYTFSIVYLNTKSISKQDGVVASLIYKDTNIPIYAHRGVDVSQKIDKIVYGKSILKRTGETREITVVGYYGARIVLTIKDDNGNSILDENLTDITTITNSNGTQINALDLTIEKGGRYSFNQEFPGITSKTTAVNGSEAASGASKVIFDDLTGVRVGDKLILSSASRDTITHISVTALNPDGDNKNECTVSPNLTAADNARVIFKRSRTYNIDWYYYATPAVGGNYKLYQRRNPVLTLKGKGNSKYVITQFDGVATSLSANQDYEKGYNGISDTLGSKTGRYTHIKETFNFSYLLTAAGGGGSGYERFTALTIPVFNKSIKAENASNMNKKSDWTNSVVSANGGTDINISNIVTTLPSAPTATLSGTVTINRWGAQDVTMELDFDKLLTYA